MEAGALLVFSLQRAIVLAKVKQKKKRKEKT